MGILMGFGENLPEVSPMRRQVLGLVVGGDDLLGLEELEDLL